MRRGAAILLALAVGVVAAAQAPSQPPPPALPAFDVVSVRPFKVTGPWHRGPVYDPERLTIEGMYLQELIREAYQVNYNQIVGLPQALPKSLAPGTGRHVFTVIGAADKPTSKAQMQLMLRRVLAERFQLVVEDATRVQPVYNLVVAAGGPKLRASKSDNDCAGIMSSEKYDSLNLPPESMLIYFGCTLDDLVERLNQPGWAGVPNNLPVIDKTGLTGRYAMVLWRASGGRVPHGGVPGAFRYSDLEPLQGAIKRELGLELVKSTGPYRELIIKHIAEPIPN
ncbi:MAG: TIGR03435 family protein [Terriglobales bacterium]